MKNIKLSNEVYDVMKWICLIVLPALEVLISTLGGIWEPDIPVKQIVESIAAVHVFMGALLGISCYNYYQENKEE